MVTLEACNGLSPPTWSRQAGGGEPGGGGQLADLIRVQAMCGPAEVCQCKDPPLYDVPE